MNEISHTQARRLLRQAQDRRLPEEQWVLLQAHLEGCADCRRYQDRLTAFDKDLRRTLRTRWGHTPGPQQSAAAALMDREAARTRLRQRMRYAWLLLLIPLGLLLYSNTLGRRPGPESPRQAGITGTPTAERSDVPGPRFLGAALFQGEHEGNSEIYLINANGLEPEVINLTQHPAADTDPIWSPDGQWIAFLSNRPIADETRSRREVYIMHVSGARLTQITVDASLSWQGPLSWSPEGGTIAAVGTHVRPGEFNRPPGQIYLIPLDGSSPYPLGGTQGAQFPRFAPETGLLAYQVERDGRARLETISLQTGHRAELTAHDSDARMLSAGSGGAFDWSPDGTSLMYTTFGPLEPLAIQNGEGGQPVREIRRTLALNRELSLPYDSIDNLTVTTTAPAARFDDVLWSPDGRSAFYLQTFEYGDGAEAERPDCAHLSHRTVYQPQPVPDVSGPCVSGSLEAGSWSSDGRWLMFSGTNPLTGTRGVVALYNPSGRFQPIPGGRSLATDFLVDAVQASGAVLVRPENSDLVMTAPQPNTLPRSSSTAYGQPPPEPLLSRVLLVRRGAGGDQIVRPLRGGQDWASLAGPGAVSCPSLAPDGERVAYLANVGENPWNELHLFLWDGQGSRQLTTFEFMVRLFPDQWSYPLPKFGCPVWSPDGLRLAAVVDTGQGHFLAIIDVPEEDEDGEGDSLNGQYFVIDTASTVETPLRWSPDGRRVLLAYRSEPGESRSNNVLRIAAAELESLPPAGADPAHPQPATAAPAFDEGYVPPELDTLFELETSDQVGGLALSPDGRWLAYLDTDIEPDYEARSRLNMAGAEGFPRMLPSVLPIFSALAVANGYRELVWWGDDDMSLLPAGRMGYVFNGNPAGREKAALYVFDPLTRKQHLLAGIPDQLYDAAFAPDGSWVLYSTETGLYALEIEPALKGIAVPTLLSREKILDITWN